MSTTPHAGPGNGPQSGPLGTLALTALAPMAWGTTYVVTTELLPPGRPLLAGALRALPAGLILLAVTRRLPSGAWWWRAAVLGSVNGSAAVPSWPACSASPAWR